MAASVAKSLNIGPQLIGGAKLNQSDAKRQNPLNQSYDGNYNSNILNLSN